MAKKLLKPRKPIPKKGSKIICLDDIQYRWIAYATQKGTEVRVVYNEAIDGQMLVAQVPKVFDLRWLEKMIDYGLENGWDPSIGADEFTIRKTKESYRIITDED
ncbi:MAG: hypothetical protein QMC23_05485 [Rubritalea sp.]|jgi:hypothetical protein